MGKRSARSQQQPRPKRVGEPTLNRFGTVILLLQDPSLAKRLLRLFKQSKLEAKSYTCHRQLVSSHLPNQPTCLVACVSGCEMCGLAAYEELKKNGLYLPVVFLARTTDFRLAVRAMRAGAENLLLIPFKAQELLASVSSALERSRRFLKASAEQSDLRRRASALTEREREIVNLVVSGMINKEIASHLKLALVTVKVHRGNAMRKLRARTSAQLARIARISGISGNLRELPSPGSATKTSQTPGRRGR